MFLVGMCKVYIDSSSIIVWETLAGALALSWGNLHFSFFLSSFDDGRTKVCAWCFCSRAEWTRGSIFSTLSERSLLHPSET